jgi:hypothetical protein
MLSAENAILLTKLHGIIRLISFLSAFIFWYVTLSIIYFLISIDIIPFVELSKLVLVVITVGLSPFLLTILTWRLCENCCVLFLDYYQKKHLKLD